MQNGADQQQTGNDGTQMQIHTEETDNADQQADDNLQSDDNQQPEDNTQSGETQTGGVSQDADQGTVVAIGTQTQSGFTVNESKCSFAGDWSSNWGDMQFSQEGNVIDGTYTYDSGKISGTVNGNVLVGKWFESPSYAEPNDAGDIEFSISNDCSSFSGNWRYGSSGSWNGDWTATRK